MTESVDGIQHSLATHVWMLHQSYLKRAGRPLLPALRNPGQALRAFTATPVAIVSHGTEMDPVFNYGNPAALRLFEMDWEHFTQLPSRKSAEAPERSERLRLLSTVTQHGIIQNYRGIRVSATGRRFCIRNATVWNLEDAQGVYRGQAAAFAQWEFLDTQAQQCQQQ